MKEGWKILPFGEVCEISGGSQPPKKYFIYEPKEGYIRLVQVRDYRTDSFITYIPKEKAKKFCSKTDIMIGRYGPPIFGIFSGIEGAYNVALMKAIPNEELLDKEYFRWFLKNKDLIKFVEKSSKRAAGQDGVRKEVLYTYPVPIPPLHEQKQIVNTLDKAFKQIDQAKANLEQNLHNAKELFQSKLNEVFSQRGEGWEEKRLGEACLITMGQSPKGTSYNSEGIGIPLINGPVEFGKSPFAKTVKTKFTTEPTKLCKENDLILCVRGSTTGKINISGFEACIGRGVASIRFEENQKWLNYFIRANQSYIYSLGTGSTFPNVSGAILKKILFPIPPIKEQNELVVMMEMLLKNTDELIIYYQQKLNNLEELKKSILQKAFRGEL